MSAKPYSGVERRGAFFSPLTATPCRCFTSATATVVKSQQNAYVERFNRTVRYDWLTKTEVAIIETGL